MVDNTAFWKPLVQPGMLLEIDSGANAEVVAVNNEPAWNILQVYTVNTLVSYNGGIYRCFKAPPAAGATFVPTNSTYWVADTFRATFTRPHQSQAAPIICRGNPGPQTIYNPHDDPGVVLHMSVIK